jgi:uncharacterized membrane protein
MKKSLKKIGRKLLTNFLRGLLLVAPTAITIYLLVAFVRFADSILPVSYPGLGLTIILIFISLVGVFSYSIFFRLILDWFDELMMKAPLTKMIYSSIKDLFGAFMGEKKMFNQPVMVLMFKESGISKIGFVTQKDMNEFGIAGMVAVYFPHSYNFSGNLYLVPKENIKPLENWASNDALKFVVSGGVSGFSDSENSASK